MLLLIMLIVAMIIGLILVTVQYRTWTILPIIGTAVIAGAIVVPAVTAGNAALAVAGMIGILPMLALLAAEMAT